MNDMAPGLAFAVARPFEPQPDTPDVSVVLPVRNGEAFLAEAIESIRRQTFRNFECLVIDDRSSDDSVAIVLRVAERDQRFRLLINPGCGLVDALNHGIQSARAPLIARMDADDISHPERFEKQVAFLKARPDVAVLGCQARTVDVTGRTVLGTTGFPVSPLEIATALTTRGCVVRHPTVMMRRETLLEIGLHRPAMRDGEDIDLWLRISERHAIANLPEDLLDYRVHPSQISREDNLQQKFAHALALLSARRRRAAEADPVEGMLEPLDPMTIIPGDHVQDAEVLRLLAAMQTLTHLTQDRRTSPADLAKLLSALETKLIPLGRKALARVLIDLSVEAWRAGASRLSIHALMKAVRVAPRFSLNRITRGRAKSRPSARQLEIA